MSRPRKEGLDYFRIDCDFFSNPKIRRIGATCGPLSAFALIALLKTVFQTSYWIKWDQENDPELLVTDNQAFSAFTADFIRMVVAEGARRDFFDQALLEKGILTGRGIQEHFFFAIKEAREKPTDFPFAIVPIPEFKKSGRNSDTTGRNSIKTGLSPVETRKSPVAVHKEKKSKEKKRKEEEEEAPAPAPWKFSFDEKDEEAAAEEFLVAEVPEFLPWAKRQCRYWLEEGKTENARQARYLTSHLRPVLRWIPEAVEAKRRGINPKKADPPTPAVPPPERPLTNEEREIAENAKVVGLSEAVKQRIAQRKRRN